MPPPSPIPPLPLLPSFAMGLLSFAALLRACARSRAPPPCRARQATPPDARPRTPHAHAFDDGERERRRRAAGRQGGAQSRQRHRPAVGACVMDGMFAANQRAVPAGAATAGGSQRRPPYSRKQERTTAVALGRLAAPQGRSEGGFLPRSGAQRPPLRPAGGQGLMWLRRGPGAKRKRKLGCVVGVFLFSPE